jgi:hypothetical protein
MSGDDLVMRSFEIAAERVGDITAPVYERYYGLCPASKSLMSHIDGYVQGRMLEEVIELLLTERPETLRDYLRFETKTHVSYGVEQPMYANLLAAVRDTVRDALASDWNVGYERAWDDRVGTLLAEIAQVSHG